MNKVKVKTPKKVKNEPDVKARASEQLVVSALNELPFDINKAEKVARNVWKFEGKRYTIRFFDPNTRKFVSLDEVGDKATYKPKPKGGKLARVKEKKRKMPETIKEIVLASLEACGGTDFVASAMRRFPKEALKLLGKMQVKEVSINGAIQHNLSMVDVIRRRRMANMDGNKRLLTDSEAKEVSIESLDKLD